MYVWNKKSQNQNAPLSKPLSPHIKEQQEVLLQTHVLEETAEIDK